MCSHGSECCCRDSSREVSGYPRIWRPASRGPKNVPKLRKITGNMENHVPGLRTVLCNTFWKFQNFLKFWGFSRFSWYMYCAFSGIFQHWAARKKAQGRPSTKSHYQKMCPKISKIDYPHIQTVTVHAGDVSVDTATPARLAEGTTLPRPNGIRSNLTTRSHNQIFWSPKKIKNRLSPYETLLQITHRHLTQENPLFFQSDPCRIIVCARGVT